MSFSSSAVDGCDRTPLNRSVSCESRSLVSAGSVGLVVVRYDPTAAPISSVAAESVREGTCDHEAQGAVQAMRGGIAPGVRRTRSLSLSLSLERWGHERLHARCSRRLARAA